MTATPSYDQRDAAAQLLQRYRLDDARNARRGLCRPSRQAPRRMPRAMHNAKRTVREGMARTGGAV